MISGRFGGWWGEEERTFDRVSGSTSHIALDAIVVIVGACSCLLRYQYTPPYSPALALYSSLADPFTENAPVNASIAPLSVNPTQKPCAVKSPFRRRKSPL